MPQAKSNEIPFNMGSGMSMSISQVDTNIPGGPSNIGKKFLIFWIVVSLIVTITAIVLKNQNKDKPLQIQQKPQINSNKYRSEGSVKPTKAQVQQKPKIDPNNRIYWVNSYYSGLSSAKESGRTLMIYFYTDWCKWCKKIEKETLMNQELVKVSRKFVSVRINGDKNKEIVKKFGINGYPTLIFSDPNENVIDRIVGFAPSKTLIDKMEMISSGMNKAKIYKPEVTQKDITNDSPKNESINAEVEPEKILSGGITQQKPPVDEDPYYYHNLAHSYEKQGDVVKAINNFRKAIEISPNDSTHRRCLGILLNRIDNTNEAIYQFEKALELNPTDAEAYHQLGHVNWKLRDFQKSISNFERAIGLAPQNETYYYCGGKAFYELGLMELDDYHSCTHLKKAYILINKVQYPRNRQKDFDQLRWNIRKAYFDKAKRIFPGQKMEISDYMGSAETRVVY